MTRPLLVIGAGGHARELLDIIDAINDERATFDVVGVLDDDARLHGTSVHGIPVLGGIDAAAAHPRVPVAVGIGSSAVRARVVRRLASHDGGFPALVHPGASLTRRVALGPGAVVATRAVVTTNVTIGAHAHVNVAATVSHDCTIGDFATIGPGSHLAGAVAVGAGCDIGVGVCAIPGVRLGAWSIVGAGAVVTADAADDATLVGVPARAVRQRAAGWHEAPA